MYAFYRTHPVTLSTLKEFLWLFKESELVGDGTAREKTLTAKIRPVIEDLGDIPSGVQFVAEWEKLVKGDINFKAYMDMYIDVGFCFVFRRW